MDMHMKIIVIAFTVIFFFMSHFTNAPLRTKTVEAKEVEPVFIIDTSQGKNLENNESDEGRIQEKKSSFTERLGKKGPELRFDLYGKFVNGYLTKGHIEIFNTAKSKRIQKIIINDNYEETHFDWSIGRFDYNKRQIQMVDMNFDGYLDLRLLDNEGATGNNWYASFLYDPEKGKFIHNWHLSSLSGLTVDPENKQILAYDRCGWCFEFIKYYKYRNGHYRLSKIEWTDVNSKKPPGCFKVTGIPKVMDIKINIARSCDPGFSDYIKKRVAVVKIEGLDNSLLDGR